MIEHKRESLEDYLTRPSNIEALEDSLTINGGIFLDLQAKKDLLGLQKPLPKERLSGLFHEVCSEIRGVLGLSPSQVSHVDLALFEAKYYAQRAVKVGAAIGGLAAIVGVVSHDASALTVASYLALIFGGGTYLAALQRHYGPGYDPGERVIHVGHSAGEYKEADWISKNYLNHISTDKRCELEGDLYHGFVMGVRNNVGRALAEKYDEAYQYYPLADLIPKLQKVYQFVCQESGRTPRHSLVGGLLPESESLIKIPDFFKNRDLSSNLATAAVAVGEERFGKKIYQQLLRDDVSFLRTA